jgi:hypothetical protein
MNKEYVKNLSIDDLNNMTTTQLRYIVCDILKLVGHTKTARIDLIDLINNYNYEKSADHELDGLGVLDDDNIFDNLFAGDIVSKNQYKEDENYEDENYEDENCEDENYEDENYEDEDVNDVNVKIVSGAESREFPIAGKTVSEAVYILQEIMNIDVNDYGAMVNGEVVSKDYVIKAGDKVVYIKPVNSKA